MTPCALHHGLSTAICGCAPKPDPAPKPDVTRNFSELAVGARVRFAGKIREVELCGQCRLPAALLDSKHRGVRRRAWVHDAVVGPAGYQVLAQCVDYVYPPQKKTRKKR